MPTFDKKWDSIRATLQAAEDRYRAVRLRPKPDWPPRGEEAERIQTAVEDACALYLRSSHSERDQMREFVASTYTINPLLLRVLSESEVRLSETGHLRWLDMGLAAASLEDLKLDYRDSYVSLGSIYLTALKAGIDPSPHFERAAELSSPEIRNGGASTRDFFARFEDSAYFHESVERKARRLRMADTQRGSDG